MLASVGHHLVGVSAVVVALEAVEVAGALGGLSGEGHCKGEKEIGVNLSHLRLAC